VTFTGARGVIVTYEAIRRWCRKFGRSYANQLRHRRPRPGDKWHLDEVFLTIRGERHYLWRAVDQDGHLLLLDIFVQRRRDKYAAKKFRSCTSILRIIATPENQVAYLRFTDCEGGMRDDARPVS
jgi:transposase-like protein